ncbi:MAG TPA: hypothetical protein VMK42_06495 [Anaeromyxobacteraceae bacterium]|nr:hypothetical protein [Anaeromyxobacteraceae bacterium]
MAAPRSAARGTSPSSALARETSHGLEAVLRWRARWLDRAEGLRVRQATRVFPVLLHTSFQRAGLDGEAPGVQGMRYRRSWAAAARAFDLPPPWRAQRGTCLAEAVVACPGPEALEFLVLVPRGLRSDERLRLEDRVGAALEVLRQGGVPASAALLDPVQLAAWESALRAFLFGALVAGRPAPPTWSGLEQACGALVEPAALARLSLSAPTSFCALGAALLASEPTPGPLAAVAEALAQGVPARHLADPELALVAWARRRPGVGEDLEAAHRLARAAASPDCAEPVEPGAAVRLGRRLVEAYLRVARRSPTLRASPRHRDPVGPGFPRVLLPALGQLLQALASYGSLDFDPVPSLHGFEVRLRDGTPLGHGATPVQARVRALALAAEAGGEALLTGIQPPWRALALRMLRPRARPTLLLVAEAASGNEPPFDPLNRGPKRELGFAAALVARIGPGRQPSARVLAASEAVESFLRSAVRKVDVEVVPSRNEARPVAVRLAQVAGLLGARVEGAEAAPLQGSVAIQAGGSVYLGEGGRLRRFPLDRFLERPRGFQADPDAPDLSLGPGDRKGQRWPSSGMIQARVYLLDPQTAVVLYADGTGTQFRERVPLRNLEEHLRDARALLQEAQPGAVLALRIGPEMEPALRKVNAAPAADRVEVVVGGVLPLKLQVKISGEWFGGSAERPGWTAAALAALARWTPGYEGHLACKSARAIPPRGPGSGIVALYARSVALRRLRTHIARQAHPYRVPEGSRRDS